MSTTSGLLASVGTTLATLQRAGTHRGKRAGTRLYTLKPARHQVSTDTVHEVHDTRQALTQYKEHMTSV